MLGLIWQLDLMTSLAATNDFPYRKTYNNENENWAAGEVKWKVQKLQKKKKKGRENLKHIIVSNSKLETVCFRLIST